MEKGKDLAITGDTEVIKRLDDMRKDMKLDTMEELEKAATSQGISFEDFKLNCGTRSLPNKVIGKEVGSALCHQQGRRTKFYDEHKSEMERPERVSLARSLFTPKNRRKAGADNGSRPKLRISCGMAAFARRSQSQRVLKQIREGANSDDLAKKYSDGPSAAPAATRLFKRGTLAKELEDKTFAMKTGEVTDVIRTKQGFVILKVTDHQWPAFRR